MYGMLRESFYLLKLPSSLTTALILDLKLLQTFATVSLLKDPITSFIFWIRYSVLLRDFSMSHTLDSPHTK